MSAIRAIDQGVKKVVFSLFWWFINPLEKDRLFNQITDEIERRIDVTNPRKILAPDSFEVLVNNTVFIKHAHAIKTLESVLKDRLQQYVADRDYELNRPRIQLQILSSATISKRKAEIRCWFSAADEHADAAAPKAARFELKVVDGEGAGTSWPLMPGNTYKIGRHPASHICLPHDKISKHHATLYCVSENAITIVDEGSANGTFIADEPERIQGSREIKVGDKIRFCKRDPIIVTLAKV